MSESIKSIHPPWTPEQVFNLNHWQYLGIVHPFTCTCGGLLVAMTDGWHCPRCPDYLQKWAHPFMADGSYIERQAESHEIEAAERAERESEK